MSTVDLTQAEADALLKMDKHCTDKTKYVFPIMTSAMHIPLCSTDKREEFMLDITKSYVQIAKNSFQTRVRKMIILARIDIGGAPHRNPDDQEIPCPHLHLYKESYGDKWAHPLPDVFLRCQDNYDFLNQFMDYCHIVEKPIFEPGLFS